MKILLVYSYPLEKRVFYEEDIKVPPIGIYYVASVLKENGYDVEIINWYEEKERGYIEEEIRKIGPDIIGFSVLNANRWSAIEISEIAKKIDPKIKIVFGGPSATFLWKHFLKNFPSVDYILLGEAEYTFLELLRDIEKGKKEHEIKGIAFRKNGKPFKTEKRKLISDLDSIPIPSRYFTYRHVISSRGCPWNCIFCGSPLFWERKVRFRSPKNFVDEIEILYRKGIDFFYFSDDNLTIKKERTIDICKEIIKRKLEISWYAISRVDCVDEDVLFWMRKAGCIQISYGVESGSERIRKILGKPLDTENILRAFDLTRRYGILPRAYFIYGSPTESWETINETIDLIHKIKPLSCMFYILDIFPGTQLYENIKKLGIDDDVWLNRIEGIMYWEIDRSLSKELILEFGKRLRDEFYRSLPEFAESLLLIDRKDLYEKHADFLSRLAMTFSHGDYSRMNIPDKEKVAEKLYRASLSYAPNQRAYLGLGSLLQMMGRNKEAIEILEEGIGYFPKSEELHICLGISYMNEGRIQDAISCFEKFPFSPQAKEYLQICKKITG